METQDAKKKEDRPEENTKEDDLINSCIQKINKQIKGSSKILVQKGYVNQPPVIINMKSITSKRVNEKPKTTFVEEKQDKDDLKDSKCIKSID